MNAELVKQHPFMDERTGDVYRYYKVPKQMLDYGKQLGISTDETLLYTILRDRVGLSLQNGKVDPQGRIYIYYSREKAAECLGWSKRKTIDVFKQLVDHGLLHEEDELSRSGKMLGRKLYIRLWQDIGIDFSLNDIINKNFKFATAESIQETTMGSYYRLPVVLVEDERYKGINLRSILLYMVILDRISLSKRYGRVDENGLLWTTINPEITGKELGCSARSLSRSFKDLEEIGLIERRSVEYAERWRIYVRDFAPPPIDPSAKPSPTPSSCPEPDFIQENSFDKVGCESTYEVSDANSAPLTRQIYTPDTPDLHISSAKSAPLTRQICTHNSPNLHPNQPPSNYPPLNQLSEEINLPAPHTAVPEDTSLSSEKDIDIVLLSYSIIHYDDVLSLLYSQLDEPSSEAAIELLDICQSIVLTDLQSQRVNILFGNRSIPKESVLAQYRTLSTAVIFLLIEKTLPHLSEVKDLYAYLHWGLFTANAHHKRESYFLKQELGN